MLAASLLLWAGVRRARRGHGQPAREGKDSCFQGKPALSTVASWGWAPRVRILFQIHILGRQG